MRIEKLHKLRNNLLVAILGAFIGGAFENYFVKEFSLGFLNSNDIFVFLFALVAILSLEVYREYRDKK